MKSLRTLLPVLLLYALIALRSTLAGEAPLRMNEIKIVGTHNSYHVAKPPERLAELAKGRPSRATWNYSHPPLNVQLDRGICGFELDV